MFSSVKKLKWEKYGSACWCLATPAGFFRICKFQNQWTIVLEGKEVKRLEYARQADAWVKEYITSRLKNWIDAQNAATN